jgi:Ulp1 family protease
LNESIIFLNESKNANTNISNNNHINNEKLQNDFIIINEISKKGEYFCALCGQKYKLLKRYFTHLNEKHYKFIICSSYLDISLNDYVDNLNRSILNKTSFNTQKNLHTSQITTQNSLNYSNQIEPTQSIDIFLSQNFSNYNSSTDEILISGFGIQVRRYDYLTLDFNEQEQTYNQLNDNIIDFYLNMICYFQKNKNIYSISPIIIKKYLQIDKIETLKSWHSSKNLFNYNMLFAPICHSKHWMLFCINVDQKLIIFMNSYVKILNNNLIKAYFSCIRALLVANANENEIDLNIYEWKLSCLKNLPQQTNNFDCGVFICMFARYIIFNYKIDFKETDMPNFRHMIKHELSKFELKTIDNAEFVPDFAIWA